MQCPLNAIYSGSIYVRSEHQLTTLRVFSLVHFVPAARAWQVFPVWHCCNHFKPPSGKQNAEYLHSQRQTTLTRTINWSTKQSTNSLTRTHAASHTHTLHNAGYSIWHERLNAKLHNFAQFLFIFQLLRSPFGRENWIQKSIFFTFHCQQQQPHTGVLGWYFIFHSDPFVDAYSIDDGFIFTLVCFLPPNTRTGKTE